MSSSSRRLAYLSARCDHTLRTLNELAQRAECSSSAGSSGVLRGKEEGGTEEEEAEQTEWLHAPGPSREGVRDILRFFVGDGPSAWRPNGRWTGGEAEGVISGKRGGGTGGGRIEELREDVPRAWLPIVNDGGDAQATSFIACIRGKLRFVRPKFRANCRYMALTAFTLPTPLRDLVLAATPDDEHYGTSDKDKADVYDWISKVAKGDIVQPSAAKELDATLTPKTYLVGNYLTAADVALYGALHPTLSQLQPAYYYAHPALTRYFDHIQSRPAVRKAADALSPAFSYVSFDLDNMPKSERKADPPKKKEKTPKVAPGAAPAAASEKAKESSSDAAPAANEGAPKQKKEKKESKAAPAEGGAGKKAGGGKNTSAAEDSGEPVPSMIDLRVGHIVDIKKHPDADGLYIEQIDIGEETGPRTVVSGLVHYIPIEEMRDKYLVAVCNLKPANMRGVKSFAMVLCATSKDGKEAGIELIQPPPGSKPGDRVYFEGENYENGNPLSQLNPKKKIFEAIQPGFTTLETREAAWIDPTTKFVHKIRTANGVCLAPTLVGASLS